MKFEIMCLFSLLICCSLADDLTLTEDESMKGTTVDPTITYNTTTSESNMSIPIIIVEVEEEDDENTMKEQYDIDAESAKRDLNWVVVRKITNITLIKESSVDPETKKTKDVVTENRSEEYRMFHDDIKRKVLTETDIKKMPFPMRFLR